MYCVKTVTVVLLMGLHCCSFAMCLHSERETDRLRERKGVGGGGQLVHRERECVLVCKVLLNLMLLLYCMFRQGIERKCFS